MRIGVDIDGILADLRGSFIQFLKEKGIHKTEKDFVTFDWKEVLDMSTDEALDLIYEYLDTDHFDDAPLLKGAVEGIDQLHKHELFVISSRQKFKEEVSKKWIERHFPGKFKAIFICDNHYDHRTQHPIEKADVCLKHDIPLLIDDDTHHVEFAAKKGIKVIMMDYLYNQDCMNHSNITKVKSWPEIVDLLNKELI